MDEDAMKTLLDMRDGCMEVELDDIDLFDFGMDLDLEPDHDDLSTVKLDPKEARSNATGTDNRQPFSSKTKLDDTLTFEEQRKTEEPIEIDLRDVYKTYGINPNLNNRQKLFRKQSNDIVKFSIGEAYMKYVHGKAEEAMNLLFEVIRMNPWNPEPYDALGDIYHKMGNHHKALEFYLLGIEFNQNDGKRWAELAEIAHFNKMYKSALQFLNNAIKLSPRNITFHIKKCNFYEQIKQYDHALKTFGKILSFLEPEDYKIKLSIVFRKAGLLQNHLNQPKEGLNIVETLMEQYSIEQDSERFESFRLYLPNYFDLLLSNDQPLKLIAKFIQYKLIEIDQKPVFSQIPQSVDDSILDQLDSDCFNLEDIVLKSKLVCAFLYLNRRDIVARFLLEFENIEDESMMESIYRPIIPALMQLAEYNQAYVYVRKLVKHFESSKYWFWCGLCLKKMSLMEEAIVAYEKAIQQDPNNYDAVKELSDLCNKIGIPERALDNVNLNSFKVDIHLLINRCNLLFLCKRWTEFIQDCRLLLSSNLYFIENWNDVNELMMRTLTSTSLLKASKSLRRRCSKTVQRPILTGGQLTKEQFFSFWKKSIFVLLNYCHEYDQAVIWAFSALLSSFAQDLIQPILLIMFRTCIDAKVKSFTFDLGKMLVKEFRNSGKIWYAFSTMLTNIYQDYRHKRLCMRLWSDSPDNVNVLLINGHIAFATSRYLHALGIYLMIYRMQTTYRYDSFHVALAYLHLICQMHTLDKCSLFSQMVAFLNDYVQKIGKCQETYYNVGRAFHQLGFQRYAMELYQIALQTPLKIHDQRFDLAPEIAFNMAQIYRSCGDHPRANELIEKYCTI